MAKMKSKMGYKGGKNTMKTKMGYAGGKQLKATEMGAESNRKYVRRMFGSGGNTKMTNDLPKESKYGTGRKVMMRSKMSTKGGMKGGKKTK